MRPQRRPQDQRNAGAACARPRRQRCDTPAGGAHDRPVASARGQGVKLARAHVLVGERKLSLELRAAMLEASAEQCQLDLLALVQACERPYPVRGRVTGDEQHRLHASTCS